ncbi:Rhodanese-like protein [Lindgomyces ingoldianus]|uniref:Rhodanese-like protein n=1 Tax=Lindgomyces ingoldianus TaxID=673940 RepID=A0ACB6RC34_9PLEO|nr:Rhodanese-like protein [Lindgomyces ingoldianus]KAF2476834.1 Rhodanese-like protein [Lindgomyces ingoldianus]
MRLQNPLSLLLASANLCVAAPTFYWPPWMTGIVSTSWLAQHSWDPFILVIDTRPAAEYAAGHIPKAVNIPWAVPLSAWISYGPDDLLLQLPQDDYLFGNLSAAGVSKLRRIIISSSKATPPYPQAEAARIAMTMQLAGFPLVHVLNGGITKWQAEGRVVTTVVPSITPSGITGSLDRSDIVDREYVKAAINNKIILDARDPSVYNGSVVEQWASKPGHIPSAKSLPTASLLDLQGNYKDKAALADVVESVIGTDVDKDTEIIVYCGVGGYAGAVYWVLNTVLGFCNVKFYDGSSQDWVKVYDMEL